MSTESLTTMPTELKAINFARFNVNLTEADNKINISSNFKAITTIKNGDHEQTITVTNEGGLFVFSQPFELKNLTIKTKLNVYDRQTDTCYFTVNSDAPIVNKDGIANMFFLDKWTCFHLCNITNKSDSVKNQICDLLLSDLS